jgi:phage terminase large subunit
MTFVIEHKAADGVTFYGGAREAWRYRGHEFVITGPFDTGKTLFVEHKLNALLWKYPNSRAFMTRNTYKSLLSTAIVTFENKVLTVTPEHPDSPIKKYGGSKPEFYEYPNGSHLLVVGLDRPDKLLSGEFDFGYINQLEEVSLNAYELIFSRTTGRAGNAPYPQLMADANPGPPNHWILDRPTLRKFEQLHRDNPSMCDPHTGEWTPSGVIRINALQSLTGLRYKRGYLGLWAGAEGAVYEDFRPEHHVIQAFDVPSTWRRFRAIDFGYTNPFVCQWWTMDEDGRLYLYREIYMSRRTVADHARQINQLSAGEKIEFTVADHDAEDRATLKQHGIPTVAAKKDVSPGIEAVQMRLRSAGDGKARLYFFEDALVEVDTILIENKRPTSTIQELPSYSYPDGVDGKPNKEQPIKDNDHGMDTMRYMVMELEIQHTFTATTTNWG